MRGSPFRRYGESHSGRDAQPQDHSGHVGLRHPIPLSFIHPREEASGGGGGRVRHLSQFLLSKFRSQFKSLYSNCYLNDIFFSVLLMLEHE